MKNIGSRNITVSLIFLGINGYSQKKSFDVKRNEVYIDSMMTNALEKGFFPGAEVIVGNKDAVLISKNYGFQDYSKKQLVKSDDVYDLASMSKLLGAVYFNGFFCLLVLFCFFSDALLSDISF